MSEQERSIKDQIWEFTKDISIKAKRTAEKHLKINMLRVEVASIKHRINIKYKDLGRFVYESHKAETTAEESYAATTSEIFEELKILEADIVAKETAIEELERQVAESAEAEASAGNGSDADAAQAVTPTEYPDTPKPEGATPPESEAAVETDTETESETTKPDEDSTSKS